MRVNPNTENYEQVTVFGQPALFTSLRILRDQLPEEVYAYDVRHSDDGMDVAEIKEFVMVNHMGTIITKQPIEMDEHGSRIIIDDEDFNFEGYGDVKLNEFIEGKDEKKNSIDVVIVKPLQQPYHTKIKNELTSLQQCVGGYIEIISPFNDNVCLVCDEEGKLKGKPLNRQVNGDIIAGDFIIVGTDDDGELSSLSNKQIDYYKKKFDDIYLLDFKDKRNGKERKGEER